MSELRYPPIIGLCGGIGAGKDTVAEMLSSNLGYHSLAIADLLKAIVAAAFPWVPRCHFCGTQEEKSGVLFVENGQTWTGRRILEDIGQHFRTVHCDVWIRAAMMQVDEGVITGLLPRWVIPGVRHENEFKAIHARGGEVWEVRCIDGPLGRSDHISDNAWRNLPKDAIIEAMRGDIPGLWKAVMSKAVERGLQRTWN